MNKANIHIEVTKYVNCTYRNEDILEYEKYLKHNDKEDSTSYMPVKINNNKKGTAGNLRFMPMVFQYKVYLHLFPGMNF